MDKITNRIKHIYRHYKLRYSLVLALVFLLFNCILQIFLVSSDTGFERLYLFSFHVLMITIWIFFTVFLMISVYYNDETGRKMISDLRKYKLPYIELLHFYRDADPYKMDVKSLPIIDWKDAEGVILGKYDDRLIYRSAFEAGGEGQNYLLAALPGSGKTTAQIIPSALRFGGSVVAIDIKGDIYKATSKQRNIKVFSPDNPSDSCCYNPFRGIENLTIDERKAFVETMAAVLVPEEKDGKYFTDGARDFFCGISLYLLNEYIYVSLPEISQAILTGNAFDWVIKIKHGNCIEAQEYTNSYFGSNEKNVAGAYGGIAKAVRPFTGEMSKILKHSKNNEISIDTLQNGFDIYIEIPQDKISLFSPITTILIQNLMTDFMRRPDKSSGIKQQPILFLLDEFPQLQFEFKTLSAALATLRSKCVSVFIAVQSISQLSNRYGENCCKEVIDTCQFISVMSAQDPSSRKFFQDLVGSKRVLKLSTQTSKSSSDNINASSSINAHEEWEPIFRPEDFSNLGDSLIIYAKGKYIKAEKTFYFK